MNDVRVLASWVVETVDSYSAPRLVAYTCEDFHEHYSPMSCSVNQSYDLAAAQADTGMVASTDDSTVDVEAEFEVGEYEIVVLSAEESSGLITWLNNNGYAIDPATEDLLQEYIDSGSYFFAARVDLAENLGQTTLSPLQVAYDSEVLALPIRLGTVNSPGEQDLVLYTLTDSEAGQVGISNYPQVELDEDECMLPGDIGDFETWYGERVAEVLSGGDEAGWLLEYGWNPYHCDPCPDGEALPDALVVELGHSAGSWGAYFSRIRMRYTPEQADQDLLLYTSGISDRTQVRYIEHNQSLESLLPTCGVETLADPGDCEDEWADAKREERREEGLVSCATDEGRSGRWTLWLSLVGVLVLRRRSGARAR